MKHTPGKWEKGENRQIIVDNKVIAQVYLTVGVTPEEADANVSVMISAPDMLEELKSLVAILKDEGFFPDQYENAEALISRIEGREGE